LVYRTLEHELIHRTHDQQDERMPIHAIPDAAPERAGLIFLDSDGEDIAERPVIEVARRLVVDRVRLPPVRVRHEGEDADDGAEQVVQGV
jgi:hypothetical protein